MGVRRSDVIIVGVNIGMNFYNGDEYEKDDNDYDKYELRRKSKVGDMTYIIDGMSGEYFIVGELIKVDYEGYDGLGMIICEDKSKEIKAAKVRVKKFILEKFWIDSDPKYIVLSHFY